MTVDVVVGIAVEVIAKTDADFVQINMGCSFFLLEVKYMVFVLKLGTYGTFPY